MARILLMCAGGMSTSLLARRMQQAALKLGRDDTIWAIGSGGDTALKLANAHADVLLVGPQIRFMSARIAGFAQAQALPWRVIDMQAYGMMDGARVLDEAIALLRR